MKVIFNNTKLLFKTFVMDQDFVIEGTLSPTNTNGNSKNIPLEGGKKYILTMPNRSEYSLNNYHSTSNWTNLIKLGSNPEEIIYSTATLPANIYMPKYLILEPDSDMDLSVFARTDVGTTLHYHIKEIDESHNWELDSTKTLNVTQGNIASILPYGEVKQNTAYKFIVSDTSIVDVKGIRFATVNPSWTEINNDKFVVTQSGQFDIDNPGAIGTGTVDISIMTMDLSNVIG